MSVVLGLTSSRTSPGASSLAVGLGWAFLRRSLSALVIEADAAGGVLGQRLSLSPQPSLLTLVREASLQLTEGLINQHVTNHNGVNYLLAPVDPVLAAKSVEQFGRLLNESNLRPSVPTVLDLGRWSTADSWLHLARRVDRLLVVTSPRLEDVQSAKYAVARCHDLRLNVGLVVVGDEPFSPAEVAESVGTQLAAAIVHDPEAAAALRGGSFSEGAYQRSLLGRSIDGLATNVLAGVR